MRNAYSWTANQWRQWIYANYVVKNINLILVGVKSVNLFLPQEAVRFKSSFRLQISLVAYNIHDVWMQTLHYDTVS